jgi:hypothetical protein
MLHMRLPIMPVQGLDLLRPVLPDMRGARRVFEPLKLRGVTRIDLSKCRKLGFNSHGEIPRIERYSLRKLGSTG